MNKTLLRIATRKSPLALWQAEHVAAAVQKQHPQVETVLVQLTTKGDVILDSPLAKVGGKGLFVKELEQALLEDRADIAVHSMKDVPALFPPGLELKVVLARETPFDALVSNKHQTLDKLPLAAKVGTCSLRRQAQLLRHRPDLKLADLRGNVNTRLRKLDDGEYDAIILAAAGLKRLGMDSRIRQLIPAEVSLPAAGQGIMGIETRCDDPETYRLIANLHDDDAAMCINAERTLNAALGGSCQVPIGAFAEIQGDQICLRGLVAQVDGKQLVETKQQGARSDSTQIGTAAARELLAAGGREILAALGITPTL